jgi:penicillin-binding protein 1A
VAQTSFICTANITTDCNEKNAIESLHGNVNRVSVPLSQISPAMQAAVLAAEDKDFFKHGGVDPVGILRAAFIDLTGGNVTHGGSTLTQQYVKLTYLSQERTFKRKIKEAALSIKLEQKLSKKEIFQRYLNLVYFGRGAYGVQAAAQAYFNEDASHLDLAQSAMLAGIIRNPTWAASASRSKDLRHLVLGNMLADHFINQQQHDLADGTPLGVQPFTPTNGATWLGGPFGRTGDPAGAKYFMNYVERQLVTRYHLTNDQIFNGGLRVYTTLDPTMQQAAYNAVTSTLDWQGHPAGALVAIDKSGQVKAMMGGTNFDDTADKFAKVNLAVGPDGGGSRRSSGSTYKAFALAEAVHEGYSIGSIVPAPFTQVYPDIIENGQPYKINADCCDSGSTTIADGLKFSVNTAYFNIMRALGPAKVDLMARRLGVQSPDLLHPVPAHVLTTPVTVLDMASAYSTFADKGVHTDPVVISRVEDANGNVLLSNTPKRTVILSKDENGKVVYAMQQVIKGGTGTNADIGRPAAGKTGTNGSGNDQDSGNRDAWFDGYVPGFTAAVWMGNIDNSVMPASIQGATFPSEIWRKFMSAVLVNTPPADFPPDPTDLWGGRYLTSWGGTQGTYTYQGQGNTGTDTGSGPSTTAAQSGPSTTTGRGPATTQAPATSAPATTSPPVTQGPPPTTAAAPPPANARAPSG